ncbi:MAG: methyl-accepting chemotaxis protein, partial [Lachnospiraceae bacterium]|nr:methyl-accepting chemotaxis protein [Lachnospiraceae bacterium]
MKTKTIGFKINLMVDILAIIAILAIFANYNAIGNIQQLNDTVSDICVELEKAQGDLRENFQAVRLYANFTYYKMDMASGHYNAIVDSFESYISALEANASTINGLCQKSDDTALHDASKVLLDTMGPFCDYLKGMLSCAREGDFIKLPSLIDGLYPYTMQLESVIQDLRSAISSLTADALLHSDRRVDGTHGFDLGVVLVFVAIWIVLLIIVRQTISRPARLSGIQLQEIVSKIESGNGDLTERIPIKTQDEIGQLVGGVNSFIEGLQGIMQKLKHQADTLMNSVRKVGTQVADSTENASSVSSVMEELSASMEEISATLGQIASGSNAVMGEIRNMDKRVQDGVDLVSQ